MADPSTEYIPMDAGEEFRIVVYDGNARRVDQLLIPKGYEFSSNKAWAVLYGWLMQTIIQYNDRRSGLVLPPNDIEVIRG